MRLSVALLIVSLAGIIGGAWLIGLPAVGGAVIFDSLCVGAWALARDDGLPPSPQAYQPGDASTLQQVLERAKGAA